MEAYEVPVRIVSAFVTLLGTAVHSLVIYLNSKRGKADCRFYALFMSIYSGISIYIFVVGSFLINRFVYGKRVLLIFYGFGSYLGADFCTFLEAFYNPVNNVLYVMIPIGMAFRVLIVYNRKLKRDWIVFAVAITILVHVPSMVMTFRALPALTPNNTDFLDDEMLSIIQRYSAVIYKPATSFEFTYLVKISYRYMYVCVPATYVLGLITYWRLHSRSIFMSAKTTKIHKAFVLLLFTEATALCSGFLYDIGNKFFSQLFPNANVPLTMDFYDSVLASLVPLVQGIATICLVPYFRSYLLKWFRRGKEHTAGVTFVTQSTF